MSALIRCERSPRPPVHQRLLLAAVDFDHRAVDEMREVGGEVGDQVGDLLASAMRPSGMLRGASLSASS
jgi:hypothetical protein